MIKIRPFTMKLFRSSDTVVRPMQCIGSLAALALLCVGCSTGQNPTFNPSGSLGQSLLRGIPSDRMADAEGTRRALSSQDRLDVEEDVAVGRPAQVRPMSRSFQTGHELASTHGASIGTRSQYSQNPIAKVGADFAQFTRTSLRGLIEPTHSPINQDVIYRGQSGDSNWGTRYGTNNDYPRGPQRLNDASQPGYGSQQPIQQTTFQETIPGQENRVQVPADAGNGPILPGRVEPFDRGPFGNPGLLPGEQVDEFGMPNNFADIDVFVQEAQSGRFMIGAGFNSDAGVTGQLIVDERNFDIARPPSNISEIIDGQAWRGAGQGFRLEAMPGSIVQRYLVSFSEPYLPYTQISMNVSGYFYDRNFFDWDEQRLGGRLAFGYRLTPDLSVTAATRLEQVKLFDPRTTASPELNAALGESDLLIGQLTLTHDTRDHPFAPTEGHLFEMSFSQAFGTYDYPRGDLDYRRYFLVRERPDGSGRHTISVSTQLGVSGAQTPIFENYYAGGVTSLRGFDFRGAVPVSGGVRVGGQFRWINSVEYLFPVTADDMIKGVVFCDFGTVESDVRLDADTFRVAPGIGVRVSVPNFGGAPLAFDLAFPVAKSDFDDVRNFSFFMGLLR